MSGRLVCTGMHACRTHKFAAVWALLHPEAMVLGCPFFTGPHTCRTRKLADMLWAHLLHCGPAVGQQSHPAFESIPFVHVCVCACVYVCGAPLRLETISDRLPFFNGSHACHTHTNWQQELGLACCIGRRLWGANNHISHSEATPQMCVCVALMRPEAMVLGCLLFTGSHTCRTHTHTSAAAAAAQLGLTCFTAGQSVSGLQQTQKPKNEQLCQAGQSAKHSCSLFLRFLFCNSGFSGGGSKQSQQPMLLHERWCHIFIRVQ